MCVNLSSETWDFKVETKYTIFNTKPIETIPNLVFKKSFINKHENMLVNSEQFSTVLERSTYSTSQLDIKFC